MTNPYQALTSYEGDRWKEFLDNIHLLDVFGELLPHYTHPESTRKIIRYIVWTYSADSDKLVLGMDWEENKKKIYQQAGLPGSSWNDIGLLQDNLVLRAIHNWLTFQGDPVFKQLETLKDLKLEMQISATGKVVKSSGEVDYDQKFRNAEYAEKLAKMIQDLENQYIQNNPKLQQAIKETKFSRKNTTTGVERFVV